MNVRTYIQSLSALSDEDFHILYTSLRDGKNYAPTANAALYVFIDVFLRNIGDEVLTFKGRLSRAEYAEVFKDSRKYLKNLLPKLERSPYKAVLNLLPKDVVAFQFFLQNIFPLLISSGASPKAVEDLVEFLFSLPKEEYFKALRFLAKYLKKYGSPRLTFLLLLLKHMDWKRWDDGPS